MPPRDNFSPSTKRTLAIRAAHFCSNPSCLKLTAGPHSDEEKSLQTGHAAHIHAAQPGGARYDKDQSKAQRKSAANAIWMCRECGIIVDNDEKGYPAETLRRWKKDHEGLINEVRTKGFAKSIELIKLNQRDRDSARMIVAALTDRRSLWEKFDAECPDRVRMSLDTLRDRLWAIRGNLHESSPLNAILIAMTNTIISFFRGVEKTDLSSLRCDAGDPEWIKFSDALAALRKSIGYQMMQIHDAFEIPVGPDLRSIMPISE